MLRFDPNSFPARHEKKIIPHEIATAQIEDWTILFPVIESKPQTLKQALSFVEKYQLAFWDAMILATARDAGVKILFSEDFYHNSEIAGIQIVNPFK